MRGIAARDKAELRVYAQPKLEFFPKSTASARASTWCAVQALERNTYEKFTFKAAGEKLSPLFDGTEQLISLISVPWYQREVYLPGS